MRKTVVLLVVALVLSMGVVACKKGTGKGVRSGPRVPDAGAGMQTEDVTGPRRGGDGIDEGTSFMERGRQLAETQLGELQTVFFDYDSSELSGSARAVLAQNTQWMKLNPEAFVVLEGHADERGTEEYNQALGERRARAARDYLVALDIDPSRLSTVSYGEERPVVRGSDESSYSRNRRVEFKASR